MAPADVPAYLQGMKPFPVKARDRLFFGAGMAATALVWLVAPNAHMPAYLAHAPVAVGFGVFGGGFLCSALYLWARASRA